MKNTRREFLTGLTKIAGGTALGYISLPLLVGCVPTSVPLQPEQTTTPIGPNGEVAVDISALTQANPAVVAPNVVGQDGYGVIVTVTPDGLVHAFSMRCTHQSCAVDSKLYPSQGKEDIHCTCHGSLFALDGSVVQGPATVPLTSYPVLPDPPTGGIANIKLI